MKDELEKLQYGIKYDRERIDKREQLMYSLPLQLIKDAFPEGHWGEWWLSDYEFTLPMRFELVQQFEEFCELQGYEVHGLHSMVWDDKNAGTFADVNTGSGSFHLAFRSTREGSTCVISKIGEEMKPIYEVTCADGAQENVFGE